MAPLNEQQLARYAIRTCDACSREHPEADDPLRSPFELDRHRIIESTAFRRLEGKTQVFASDHNDHFRTRLTHTLEAAQIARCLTVALRANEALVEAVTLAHDLGHPPFGHAGEAALGFAMNSYGGFNHNAHSLRVVEYLEHPFPAFRGLNLTAETRAGLAAHATRYDTPCSTPSDTTTRAAGRMKSRLVGSPRGPTQSEPLAHDEDTHVPSAGASVEAQIASAADRIAYNCHDLEDAIGAGFVDLDQLANVPLWQDSFENATRGFAVPHIHAIRRIVLDAMVNHLLGDVLETSRRLLARIGSPEDALAARDPLVTLSDAVEQQITALESFLVEHVYRHPEVVEADARGREMVLAVFDAYRRNSQALPARFANRIEDQGADRVICDYIAGMTDRFCERDYARLTGKNSGISS